MENQTPTVVIEQQGEKRRRGGLVWLLALAFVAVLAIGGTFAYLTYTTNQAVNRITTDPVLTADLLEPAWDAAAATEAAKSEPDNPAKDASGKNYIPADAYNMLPGTEVAKDPTIVNTSNGGAHMYAGMMLQFQVWDGSKYANMSAQQVADTLAVYGLSSTQNTNTAAGITLPTATTGGNVDKWTQITSCGTETTASITPASGTALKVTVDSDGCMYFYNSKDLAALTSTTQDGYGATDAASATAATSSLFKYVRFLDAAEQAQIDQFNKTVLKSKSAFPNEETCTVTNPGWRIIVKGAGIQVTYDSTGAATKTAADFAVAENVKVDGINWKTLLKPDTVNTTYGDTTIGDDSTTSTATDPTITATGKRYADSTANFVPTWSKWKVS